MARTRVFVSHPLYSEGSVESNLRKADNICRELLEDGFLPISPLHLFFYMDSETAEIREQIMSVCRDLILMSDEVWVYGNKGGCAIERRWAEMCRKPVRDMTGW